MFRGALCVTAAAALLSATPRVRADEPVTMAPPVQGADGDIAIDRSADNASADTVFNWKEVPANQQVPIRRAVFDQGGYQLYDKAGETIVVPFVNDNLYAMKFAVSHDGSTYFVNEGDYPVLYVPRDGYLENATVAGARWYPFNKDFHPATPVFVGIAPSWDAYCGMGWYPGMVCYGGYFCERPFLSGGIFVSTPGFLLVIGGHHCWGWTPYVDYCDYHPAPFRIAYYDRRVYGWADHHDWDRHAFYGAGHPYWVHNDYGGGFHGYGGYHDGRVTEPVRSFGDAHSFGDGRTFRGVRNYDGAGPGGSHGFGNNRPSDDRGFGGDHNFSGSRPGGDHSFSGGDHNGGGHTFHGADGGSHSSYGGDRPTSYGGGHDYGGNRSYSGHDYGGNRSYSGGDHGGNRGYSGGDHGGGHSYGGDHGGGGSRSYGGGDHGGGSHSYSGGDHGGGFSGNRR